MCTTRKTSKFTALALVFGLMAASGAVAQERYEWPDTFSGQPEFDFERQALISEIRSQNLAGRGKAKSGVDLLPTVSSLLRRNISNPFSVKQEDSEEVEAKINIALPQLPDLSTQDQLNLDEFRNYLTSIVNSAAQEGQVFDFSNYDFSKDLAKVSIQSLVASPDPYVVINNKRFTEGDRFLIPVKVRRKRDRVEEIIREQMPSPDAVSEAAYDKFREYRDEALAEYRKKREEISQSKTNDGLYKVSVSVKDIQHRQVVVSVGGRDYALKMRTAL